MFPALRKCCPCRIYSPDTFSIAKSILAATFENDLSQYALTLSQCHARWCLDYAMLCCAVLARTKWLHVTLGVQQLNMARLVVTSVVPSKTRGSAFAKLLCKLSLSAPAWFVTWVPTRSLRMLARVRQPLDAVLTRGPPSGTFDQPCSRSDYTAPPSQRGSECRSNHGGLGSRVPIVLLTNSIRRSLMVALGGWQIMIGTGVR